MSEEMSGVAVMDKQVRSEYSQDNYYASKPISLSNLDGKYVNLDHYVLTSSQRRYLVFKRIMDFAIALISIIILAVPFVVIAVIQKIISPQEPILFSQIRIGRNGGAFKVTKFRSMKINAPHDCPTKDFMYGKQYITKFGKLLRETSIDELPQLFQILTGKMSLIGPRPLIPQEETVHRMREQAGIYQLRPGMTGWAQVNGRDFVGDEDKVRLDSEYMRNIGLKMDFKIFVMTVKKVVHMQDVLERTKYDNKNRAETEQDS